MISVVMPCYNAERYLTASLDSILGQTFGDFELLAIDDGSTDNTLSLLREYAQRDSRIRVIQNPHGGISSALNRGVQEAKFNWIARMDADDVALPTRFERQIKAAEANPRVVAWGTFAYHVNYRNDKLGISKTGPTSEAEFHRIRGAGGEVHLIHPTAMLRRDVILKEGGYDARFNGCEDFELFDRMAEHGPVVAIPEPLVLYRIHASSLSMTKFFAVRRFASYVIARHKARIAGENWTLSLEQYLQDEKKKPLFSKLGWWMFHGSGFYYRTAGLAYGEGHIPQALIRFAAATALNPRYAIARVWNQFISKKFSALRKREPTPAVAFES